MITMTMVSISESAMIASLRAERVSPQGKFDGLLTYRLGRSTLSAYRRLADTGDFLVGRQGGESTQFGRRELRQSFRSASAS